MRIWILLVAMGMFCGPMLGCDSTTDDTTTKHETVKEHTVRDANGNVIQHSEEKSDHQTNN
jgi:hypothetical protein